MRGGVKKPGGDISDQKLLFFFFGHTTHSMWILLLRPGTEPGVPAVEAQNPNYCTERDGPVQRCWRRSSAPKPGPRHQAKQCFVGNTRMVAMTGGRKCPRAHLAPRKSQEGGLRAPPDKPQTAGGNLSERPGGREKFCTVVGLQALPSAGRERTHSSQDWTGGSFCTLPMHEGDLHAGDLDSIPGLGRAPGGGKGYPLQYYSLENSMDLGL